MSRYLSSVILAFCIPCFAASSLVPKKVEEMAVKYRTSQNLAKAVALCDGPDAKKIESIGGTYAMVSVFFAAMLYADFPDAEADLKTAQARPTFYLISEQSPKGRVYLAKADSQPKKSKRSVKMGRVSGFGASGLGAPDSDWTVAYDFEEVKPSIWKITPKEDLKPGEYGIYAPAAAGPGQTAAGDFFGFTVQAMN